jgi:flagellar biosynthetic protein FliP
MPALTAPVTRTVRRQGITRRVLAGGLTALALVVGLLAATPAYATPALAVAAPAAPVTPVGPEGDGAADEAPAAGAPVAPSPPQPGTPPQPADPTLRVDLGGSGDSPMNNPLTLVLLLGAMSFIPAALVMMTAFTRIVIVLGFVRTGLGTMGIPPNQVVIGLALFLSLFVMAPTLKEANEEAVKPFMAGEITQQVAFERGLEPFRDFMLTQVRDEDLSLFVKLSGDERPANASEVATTTLIPAFVISELRTAFLIGFVIFIPFIVIDLIVSAALSATGMMMLPPALLSLPFKVLLFVVADGWSLVIESLVKSFNA